MNVGKSSVMKCSRCVNVGRMHVRLNGEPLEEVDCDNGLSTRVANGSGSRV